MADNREAGLEALCASTMPAPEMKTYFEATGHNVPDAVDVWICDAGLDPKTVIPGIPKAYEQGALEGRALYVLGVLPNWQLPAFKAIFKNCGRIEQCPNLIDLQSGGVFRWVTMSTAKEAAVVLETLNGMTLAGKVLRICRALPPGATFVFSEEYPLEKFLEWQISPPGTRSEASAPTPPAVEHQPFLTVQPPTPTTSHAHPMPSDAQEQHLPAVSEGSTVSSGSSPAKHGTTDGFVPHVVSWANIVKTAREEKGDSIDGAKAQGKPPGTAPRLHPVGRIPNVNNSGPAESMAEQMRVVFLLDIPERLTLTHISDAIKEGSLVSKSQSRTTLPQRAFRC